MNARDDVVRVVVDLLVAGFIVGFDFVKIQGGTERLVYKLDCGDDICIALITGGESLDGVEGFLGLWSLAANQWGHIGLSCRSRSANQVL